MKSEISLNLTLLLSPQIRDLDMVRVGTLNNSFLSSSLRGLIWKKERKSLLGFRIGNYTTQTGIFLLLFNFGWLSPSGLFTLNWKIFVTYMTIGMSRICFLSENASLRFFGQTCTHREDKSRFKWIELHMYIECVCGRTCYTPSSYNIWDGQGKTLYM